MRIFLPFLLLLAACPVETGLQCPPNTSIVGQYALAFTAVHDAGECEAVDASTAPPTVTKLTLDNLGAKASTLCVGTGSDGGPQPQLLVPDKGGARLLVLREDGGFQFSNDAGIAAGTACLCDVGVAETFNGFLLSSGSFALRPDGGLPPITGLTATLTDSIKSDAGSCICTFPCTVTYSLTGSPL
jgi:hypothetical protein